MCNCIISIYKRTIRYQANRIIEFLKLFLKPKYQNIINLNLYSYQTDSIIFFESIRLSLFGQLENVLSKYTNNNQVYDSI